MSDEMKECPVCESPYGYSMGVDIYACPDCANEWNPQEIEAADAVKDANGNVLKNGDSVIVLKSLPIKGSASSVKAGTKVRNIRITDGDHNIDCKIDGLGAMALKSEFVRKA